jgi:uncharacterized protein Usg
MARRSTYPTATYPVIGSRLVTAEIIYCMPDHPLLLQTFVWQNYDVAPDFPGLRKFLNFWQRSIEGKLHTVKVACAGTMQPAEYRFVDHVFAVH